MKRSYVESLPKHLSEHEYVLELCKSIKKWKAERNEERKQEFHASIKQKKKKMQTFICSNPEIVKKALTLKEKANSYLIKRLRRKRKFRKMEWVSVPSCVTTQYDCIMNDACCSQTIHDKYICGGYYNVLSADFICKNCWGDTCRMSDYYEDTTDVDIDMFYIFPQIKQSIA